MVSFNPTTGLVDRTTDIYFEQIDGKVSFYQETHHIQSPM